MAAVTICSDFGAMVHISINWTIHIYSLSKMVSIKPWENVFFTTFLLPVVLVTILIFVPNPFLLAFHFPVLFWDSSFSNSLLRYIPFLQSFQFVSHWSLILCLFPSVILNCLCICSRDCLQPSRFQPSFSVIQPWFYAGDKTTESKRLLLSQTCVYVIKV